MNATDLADAIDALLPQTQCTQCGFDGCRPYAEAIARGEAPINQCPPGGAQGIAELARLLGRAIMPLNPAHGVERAPRVAWIDEAVCIGCTKCIQACPVDAIVGAAKLMHTVLVDECTGCDLCVAPCPVDCIHMQERDARDPVRARTSREQRTRRADHARARYHARNERLAQERDQHAARLSERRAQAERALAAAGIEAAAPAVVAVELAASVPAAAPTTASPDKPRDERHDNPAALAQARLPDAIAAAIARANARKVKSPGSDDGG